MPIARRPRMLPAAAAVTGGGRPAFAGGKTGAAAKNWAGAAPPVANYFPASAPPGTAAAHLSEGWHADHHKMLISCNATAMHAL